MLTEEQIKIIKENIQKLGEIFRAGEENLKKHEEEAIRLGLYNDEYFEFLEMLEPTEEVELLTNTSVKKIDKIKESEDAMNKINIIKEEDIEHDVVVDIPFEVNTCGIYVCKRIDRTEALQKSIEILEKAEQERIAVAEYEAEIRKEYEPIKYLQELIEKKKKDFEEEMQTLHWILNCMEDEYQRKIAMLKGEGEV